MPLVPDLPGKELAITSDGFFDLEQQPKKAAVIGAGCVSARPHSPVFHEATRVG